jgi:hypothetical protein
MDQAGSGRDNGTDKKFSLRRGNHDIEVRGAEGQPLFH